MKLNLQQLDLNLLLVFDALMRERNLSRAAIRLHRSQPAVSNALARLREQLDQPLFRRTAKGLEPTAPPSPCTCRCARPCICCRPALAPRKPSIRTLRGPFA